MRVRASVLSLGIAVLLLAATPASVATAAPRTHRTPTYYLALGDSLAYGYQQALFLRESASGRYDPSAFRGYAGLVAARLGVVAHRHVTEVNYGCPSETTASFLVACWFTTRDKAPVSWLHDPYTSSQLDAAEDFLRSHQGHVVAVTLSLGSNDLSNALDACVAKPGCDVVQVLPGVVATVLGRLVTIAQALEAADPGVPLAIANYYNPEVDDPAVPAALRPLTDLLVGVVNTALAKTVDEALADKGLPVAVADAYGAINRGIPGLSSAQAVCVLTGMCTPLHDIHPSTAGYASLARAFVAALCTLTGRPGAAR